MSDPRPPNRLASETSPYLLQHAHNPVDWYPWGSEALAEARRSDRPVFLSIGYAACHWCHVMERESFEDLATADQLNRDFVSVKVDREERPDLDSVYMDAVQAMTGQGGWPMSVFLTPDGRPFYGGTYFPDQPRHGMPSFRQVLGAVAEAWRERRADVEASADRLAGHVRDGQAALGLASESPVGAGHGEDAREPDTGLLLAATATLAESFDARHGGWGGAPKFPQPMSVELLLREHLRTSDGEPLAMARRTLDAMAAGGMYDHLAGGFARYSTDAVWLVPHFEKMLYDNAQLARVYLHAWQVTDEPRYLEVARETLDFMAREMRVPVGGAFASSLDADTNGEEGATYVWSAEEVRAILGSDAPLFEAAYGVRPGGNWEGSTILARTLDDAAVAERHGLERDEVRERLAASRARLLAAREERPQPGRDDKVLASWNGLALGAFADAARALRDDGYRTMAIQAATFLSRELRTVDGRLLRSWKDGRAQHAGVLEDHAHLADGLLALYEATFDERWFTEARALADIALAHFGDDVGRFYDTADDAEALIARPRSLQDNALPSGGAMLCVVLLRLAAFTGEGRYRDAAEQAIAQVAPVGARHPSAFAQWLLAHQLAALPIDEVAVVGDTERADTQALVQAATDRLRPWQVVACSPAPDVSAVALLHARSSLDGLATAYVCRGFACQRPVTSAAELAAQLARP